MFKTKSLSSIKSIFPPIHQPLPLSKRESQQLLNALTSSFRRHLDNEHGLQDDPTAPPKSRTKLRPPAVGHRASTSLRDAHRQPIDRHLRAILSNPLFSYDPKSQKGLSPAASRRNPLDIFDEAVAKGMMTTKRATGFLAAVRREILQSPSVSLTEAMATSAAGLRVVRWLRASGLERDLSLVSHHAFLNLLVPFMAAEGLEEIAWGWLERLMRGEGPTEIREYPATAYVLNCLVDAKGFDANSLDEAYSTILRGEEMFKNSPLFVASLTAPWHTLSWLSTVDSWRRASPSTNLFESFVAISDHMNQHMPLERAHLDLHHPTSPDHALAVKYLHETDWRQSLGQKPAAPAAASTKEVERSGPPAGFIIRLVSLALDTVRHLTQRGQPEEAQWIMDLLHSDLEPYVGQYLERRWSVFGAERNAMAWQ